MSEQAGAWADGQPAALGRGAVRGFIAVDEPEAWPAVMTRHVEADPSAVSELGMSARAHQLARVWVAFTLKQELGDAATEGGRFIWSKCTRCRWSGNQVGDVQLDAGREGNADPLG